MLHIAHRLTFATALALAGLAVAIAQTPNPAVARFTAVTANLNGGPPSVRIEVLSWSSDAVRAQMVDAWNMLPPASAGAARGGPVGGRGTGAPAGARGARGARGAAPDGPAAPVAAVPNTPERSLAAALDAADGVGYVWTSESTGYSIRYAYRFAQPDGGERIILATDRRLGDRDDSWKPAAGTASSYGFSLIELRLNANHEGEGKASVTGKVTVDTSANTIALEGYAGLPVTLKNVKAKN